MNQLLEKAISIAVDSHSGQVNDKAQPYVLHPLRMMFKAVTIEEKIIAVLHDVIEKTTIDLEYLRSVGFSDRIVLGIDALSRRPQENYDKYIDRVAENKLATKVKIIDLDDNINSLDLDKSQESKSNKFLKYQKARNTLT
ncbi:MAG: GTP pyrophosphokinase [Candidatus Neomarinimicrobiota bacterium]|nr:GTP pyrophosphokinase [Candidatus Neomarinimicrobiota bacterium]MED5553940.1 GTP pyrophosphokinase [Candidatus Neomarinimicrobiota bacterium]